MSLNLSATQHYCLESMGIKLWQLRNPVADSVKQHDPVLLAQLELMLNYCQQNTKQSFDWQVVNGLNEAVINDGKLELPPLDVVLSDPKLKKQLWQLMVSQS